MRRFTVAIMCLAFGGAAAAGPERIADPKADAAADLKDASGRNVGRVTMQETPEGVLMRIQLENLEPGVKAFHVHETGTCEAPAFQSAGGHFNPTEEHHGLLPPKGAHAGDLPNVHIPDTGMLTVEYLATGLTLAAGDRSLFDTDGSAVVVHAAADDYVSDPAGNAGGRIACGVVKK
jgi:Cu-Zn family superoxide dismutase